MDGVDLLGDLVSHVTVSGEPAPQRSVMESIIGLIRAVDPTVMVEHDLAGPHPWALITNDAPPSAPRLLFACHVDTVPVGNVGDWEFDPFGAEIDGGVLLGRGTSDMKAGVASASVAVLGAVRDGTPIGFLLTSDEEIGSLGAARSRDAVGRANIGAVVVPEATGNRIHLGHRGALWLEVTTSGVAAHGSTPHRGTNAVLLLMDVIDRARRELPLSSDPFLGDETWNLGLFSGGSAPNIVPDRASAMIDHRTVGDGRALETWWNDQPEVAEVRATIDLPGVRTDPANAWLSTLVLKVDSEPVTYFTDASLIASAAPGAPVIIWGPGTPSLMHAANETVELAEVTAAADAYCGVVAAWPTVD